MVGEKRKEKEMLFSLLNKMKLKSIMPSLREKKRYLAFEIIGSKIKDFRKISKSINDSVMAYLGQLGASKAGILVMEDQFKPEIQRGLIRVNNNYLTSLKSALTFIKEIDKEKIIVRSIGASGILRKAQNRYINLKQTIKV